MGMLHIIRTPHPEYVVSLTFTLNPRDWRVSQCQWICHNFCSSRMRWEGLKSWIQAVFTTVYSLQSSLLLFSLEKRGESLPGAVNPAQPVKSCHLHVHRISSQTTREEGRERKGWKFTASWTYATHCPAMTMCAFFPVKVSYLSQLNWEATTNLAHDQGAFWVTIPNEVSSLVGGLPDTPTMRTVGCLIPGHGLPGPALQQPTKGRTGGRSTPWFIITTTSCKTAPTQE